MSQKDAEIEVHKCVTSIVDYWNITLLGCPSKSVKSLRLELKEEIILLLSMNEMKFRIELKTLLLKYKALNDQAQSYIKELLALYYPNRSRCSLNTVSLVIPWVSKASYMH